MDKKVTWYRYPVYVDKKVKIMESEHHKIIDRFLAKVKETGFGFAKHGFADARINKIYPAGLWCWDGEKIFRSVLESHPKFPTLKAFHHGWFGPQYSEGQVVKLAGYLGPGSPSIPYEFFLHTDKLKPLVAKKDEVIIFSGFVRVPQHLTGVEVIRMELEKETIWQKFKKVF